MVLVDTSVWVDHFRGGDDQLAELLVAGRVATHPFVIGEIALGYLKPREEILHLLANLPKATVATDVEVLQFIEAQSLFGRGIGYADSHLLAAVRLSAGMTLWTRDKQLHAVAAEFSLAHSHE